MNAISPLPLGTIQTACRHFFTNELNVNSSTTIFNVGVKVISQQQIVNNNNNNYNGSSSSDSRQSFTDGLKMNNDDLITTTATTTTTSTTISGVSNANVIAAHVITTKLEVTVQYELNKETTELNNMDGRIRMLFSTQWKDLLDLLVLLDEDYFGNVFAIGLESSKYPLTFSTTDGDQRIFIESSSNYGDTTWQLLSLYLIIGLVAIATGIILSFNMSQSISREQESSSSNNNNNRNYRKIENPKLQPVSSNFKTLTESVSEDPPANNNIPSFTHTPSSTTTTINDGGYGFIKNSNGRRIKSYSSKEK